MANARKEDCYRITGKGEDWWYTVYVDGKRRRISTRTTVKKDADRIRIAAQDEQRRAAVLGPIKEALTFGAACGHYLDAGKSDRFLTPCFERWETTPVDELVSGIIKAGARKLYPDAKASTLRRQVIAPVCAVINHCHDMGLCGPVKVKLKGDRQWQVPRTLKVAVERDYIDALMAEATRQKPTGRGRLTSTPHLAALVLFMYQTGFRVGASTAMNIGEHIDLSAMTATWGCDKNGEPHVVPLTPECVAAIASLPRTGPNRRKAFLYSSKQSIYTTLKRMAKAAGYQYVPPHQIGRHSFASELLENGATVADIMAMGNWKSARMVVENYAHSKKSKVDLIARVFGGGAPTGTQLAPASVKAMPRKASG